jgi:type IV secretory pathway VirB2 component (pilin)
MDKFIGWRKFTVAIVGILVIGGLSALGVNKDLLTSANEMILGIMAAFGVTNLIETKMNQKPEVK